jgi:hypothetical protein
VQRGCLWNIEGATRSLTFWHPLCCENCMSGPICTEVWWYTTENTTCIQMERSGPGTYVDRKDRGECGTQESQCNYPIVWYRRSFFISSVLAFYVYLLYMDCLYVSVIWEMCNSFQLHFSRYMRLKIFILRLKKISVVWDMTNMFIYRFQSCFILFVFPLLVEIILKTILIDSFGHWSIQLSG